MYIRLGLAKCAYSINKIKLSILIKVFLELKVRSSYFIVIEIFRGEITWLLANDI